MPKMPKIPETRFEIPEAALGLYLFAADPDKKLYGAPPRPGLDYICFEPEPGKKGKDPWMHAVAANSYHMAHVKWIPDPEKDTIPKGIVLVSRVQVEAFLKGKRPKDTRYWIQEERGDWAVVGNHGDSFELQESPSEYPDWQKIIPKRPEKDIKEGKMPTTWGLNWTLLDIFQKFSRKYVGHHGFRMVTPESDRHPVLLIPITISNGYGSEDRDNKYEVEYVLNDGVTEMEYVIMPVTP
jgi:hypothetical protein